MGKVIVLFEVTIKDGKKDDYLKRAEILKAHLKNMKGFISAERFQSLASVYIWAVAGGKIPNLEEVLE